MRGAIVAAVALGVGALFVAPSCSTEGDVLFALPTPDATAGDLGPVDAALGDTAPAGDDVAELTCIVDGGRSCRFPGEQCCVHLLTMYCTTRGDCDGGGVECSRAAHCAPGLRCCGQGAGFLLTSTCRADCPVYQLCATDGECADGGRCADAAVAGFAVCE